MQVIPLFTGLCFLLVAPASAQPAGNAAPKPMRDALSQAELSRQRRQAELTDPMRDLVKSDATDPSKTSLPQDLISRSDILCFGGLATLVPKFAIVFTPSQLADRIGMRPGAKIVPWLEFYAANRGWLSTVEVTLAQAEGSEPIGEKTAERIQKGGNLTVATYQGGPISKLAPRPGAASRQKTP